MLDAASWYLEEASSLQASRFLVEVQTTRMRIQHKSLPCELGRCDIAPGPRTLVRLTTA
jgi:hypothetical protein